jgi:urease accessory protein
MNSEAFLSLLQFTDGLFPAGAYAHSFGLESYVAEGTIRDANGVGEFLLSHLQGSVAHNDVIAALATRRAARVGHNTIEHSVATDQCIAVDHALDAMKAASELRGASRQMGRQVLRIAANLDAQPTTHTLAAELFRAVENEETPGHHAVAFGAVGAAQDWQEIEMASAYLYSTCAGIVAASLRLLPIGQLAGQRILWSLATPIAKLAEEVQGKDMDDIWSFAPAIEIAAMRHATLDARLFRS